MLRIRLRTNRKRNGKDPRAGLRNLEAEERALAIVTFPAGSLRHLYGNADNQVERLTAQASTLKVEAE